jgi:hypothetical protein
MPDEAEGESERGTLGIKGGDSQRLDDKIPTHLSNTSTLSMADEAGGPKRTETSISDATRRAEPYPEAGEQDKAPYETSTLRRTTNRTVQEEAPGATGGR